MKNLIFTINLMIGLSTLLFVSFGFYYSTYGLSGMQASINDSVVKDTVVKVIDEFTEDKDSIRTTIIGDSIAFGTGDSTYKGILGFLEDKINNDETKTKEYTFNNLGINGFTSTELRELLDDQKNKEYIKSSDVLIISIGGNDIREILYLSDEEMDKTYVKVRDTLKNNLDKIINKIYQINPKINIVYIGQYNPYESITEHKQTTRLLKDLNIEIQKVIIEYDNLIYVPMYDLFKLNIDDYIFTDGLHPNEHGYRKMSERIYNAIRNLY